MGAQDSCLLKIERISVFLCKCTLVDTPQDFILVKNPLIDSLVFWGTTWLANSLGVLPPIRFRKALKGFPTLLVLTVILVVCYCPASTIMKFPSHIVNQHQPDEKGNIWTEQFGFPFHSHGQRSRSPARKQAGTGLRLSKAVLMNMPGWKNSDGIRLQFWPDVRCKPLPSSTDSQCQEQTV